MIAKDVALGITVLTGLGAQVVGRKLSNEQPFPIESEGTPAPGTPPKWRRWQRTVSILGIVQLAAAGTALVLTSALNIRAARRTHAGSRRAVPAMSLDTASHRFYTTRPN